MHRCIICLRTSTVLLQIKGFLFCCANWYNCHLSLRIESKNQRHGWQSFENIRRLSSLEFSLHLYLYFTSMNCPEPLSRRQPSSCWATWWDWWKWRSSRPTTRRKSSLRPPRNRLCSIIISSYICHFLHRIWTLIFLYVLRFFQSKNLIRALLTFWLYTLSKFFFNVSNKQDQNHIWWIQLHAEVEPEKFASFVAQESLVLHYEELSEFLTARGLLHFQVF